jgi:hypothetical protein
LQVIGGYSIFYSINFVQHSPSEYAIKVAFHAENFTWNLAQVENYI